MSTSTRPQLARLVVPLDPVELPRRPRVALRVLAPDGQVHRVPPSDVAADHTLVRDVLPHLPAQVRLDLDFAQAVDGSRGRLLRRRCRPWGRLPNCGRDVVRCGQRVRGDRRGVRGGGKEGGEGRDLGLVEIADSAAVVDLHARAEAEGGRLPDAVEVRQGLLVCA